jgi:hypothetical protein
MPLGKSIKGRRSTKTEVRIPVKVSLLFINVILTWIPDSFFAKATQDTQVRDDRACGACKQKPPRAKVARAVFVCFGT